MIEGIDYVIVKIREKSLAILSIHGGALREYYQIAEMNRKIEK